MSCCCLRKYCGQATIAAAANAVAVLSDAGPEAPEVAAARFSFCSPCSRSCFGAGFISASDSDSESDNPSASSESLRCLPPPFSVISLRAFLVFRHRKFHANLRLRVLLVLLLLRWWLRRRSDESAADYRRLHDCGDTSDLRSKHAGSSACAILGSAWVHA
jgi:hypothetical protein